MRQQRSQGQEPRLREGSNWGVHLPLQKPSSLSHPVQCSFSLSLPLPTSEREGCLGPYQEQPSGPRRGVLRATHRLHKTYTTTGTLLLTALHRTLPTPAHATIPCASDRKTIPHASLPHRLRHRSYVLPQRAARKASSDKKVLIPWRSCVNPIKGGE